jgi:hypothetical protein
VIARTALLSGLLAFARPAWPCSVVAPSPKATQLVDRASVIVRARARGVSSEPGPPGSLASSSTQVEFDVLAVLKGALAQASLRIEGTLSGHDDPNDASFPYRTVRPGGRGGNCFAMNYREGAEYLLLLRMADDLSHAKPTEPTPYWAPLSATNEQVSGADDRWVAWVRRRVRSRSGA